ncbi:MULTISPECIES: NAD(P)-dependent oxidoreductase [unclassified Shimia]|uniref:NAD(P)-dependent oxidoreductase n=1 Tax=unclassified Shimia TaxID=2630038 RepID=UPI003105FE1F
MSKPKIGFIGIGLMGSAMVHRLLATGYEVTIVANRSRPLVDKAVAAGAVEVGSAKELAACSDIVMMCMSTSDQVETRMRGDDGVLAGLPAGAVVIDFGTSLPASTKALGAETAAVGGTYLDAPLGRTPQQAIDGLLNIMAAGDKEAFDRVKPVLDDLGENVFHLGALGAGHTTKLINNFFAQNIVNALSESFAMADKAGLSRQDLYNVISAGPLHSGMMDFLSVYALEGDPSKLQFSIKNASKDVGYYVQMTKDAGVKTLMGDNTLAALEGANAAGMGEQLVPEILEYYIDQFKDG